MYSQQHIVVVIAHAINLQELGDFSVFYQGLTQLARHTKKTLGTRFMLNNLQLMGFQSSKKSIFLRTKCEKLIKITKYFNLWHNHKKAMLYMQTGGNFCLCWQLFNVLQKQCTFCFIGRYISVQTDNLGTVMILLWKSHAWNLSLCMVKQTLN